MKRLETAVTSEVITRYGLRDPYAARRDRRLGRAENGDGAGAGGLSLIHLPEPHQEKLSAPPTREAADLHLLPNGWRRPGAGRDARPVDPEADMERAQRTHSRYVHLVGAAILFAAPLVGFTFAQQLWDNLLRVSPMAG